MANVRIAVESVGPGGLDAADNGSLSVSDTYQVRNTGRTILHFKKSGAGACTATIAVSRNVGGLTVPNRTVTVPATTGDIHITGLAPEIYNDVNGDLNITLSEITGLTLAAMEPS